MMQVSAPGGSGSGPELAQSQAKSSPWSWRRSQGCPTAESGTSELAKQSLKCTFC